MALKRCCVCKDYFPEPTIKVKNSECFRHDSCDIFRPKSSYERNMEREMQEFYYKHPDFIANKSTSVAITKG